MICRFLVSVCLAATALSAVKGQDILDEVDQALTFSVADDQVRGRLSGYVDLEVWHYSGPTPGFLFTSGDDLFNPRLSVFFDTQIGPHLYAFAQARLDRGFDPQDDTVQTRLDEYAVRWTPWDDGRFSLQAGRFATVVGNWASRHLSWDNPFINAPLVYETITAIYDAEVPESADAFLEGITDEPYEYNPVIWGPSYATGLSVSGRLGKFDYAAEIKNTGLSSRPESWDLGVVNFDHPTFSARIGYRPTPAWNMGISGSEGAYLLPETASHLPTGTGLDDFKQQVLGQDISFAWHHWQLWAEIYEARFQVPNTGDAECIGAYIEAKYKFTPQLYGALRWNVLTYNSLAGASGEKKNWGSDLWRTDAVLGYRFTPYSQLKLQYSFQNTEADAGQDLHTHLVAAQFTIRF